MTGAVIAAVEVTRRFRRGTETVLALADVSVGLRPGEVTVAAGPSGSGKTTLLSVLAGIEPVDRGTVVTGPPLPARIPPSRLRWHQLAFVPQALGLLDELSLIENVDLAARLAPRGAGWPAADLLARLELGHLADRYPTAVSGGEQQRAALARALRLRPAVLLADEPTGHQDRARAELVLELLRQHAGAGAAVLLTSHDPEVIAGADRVLRLADGRIAADSAATGSPPGRLPTDQIG